LGHLITEKKILLLKEYENNNIIVCSIEELEKRLYNI